MYVYIHIHTRVYTYTYTHMYVYYTVIICIICVYRRIYIEWYFGPLGYQGDLWEAHVRSTPSAATCTEPWALAAATPRTREVPLKGPGPTIHTLGSL